MTPKKLKNVDVKDGQWRYRFMVLGVKRALMFPIGTAQVEMERAAQRMREHLERQNPATLRGTLTADVATFLKTSMTRAHRTRLRQQLAWWCAQPAALGAKPLTVAQWQTERDAIEAGTQAPRTHTLGEMSRALIEPPRLREILKVFVPTGGDDPNLQGQTSNHYRQALVQLYNVLEQDEPLAYNPLTKVKTRRRAKPNRSGYVPQIIREVLKHVPSLFGKSGIVTERRLNALAWINWAPVQLDRFDPRTDFHDVPDATFDEIANGAITIDKPARFKGQGQTYQAAERVPINPWAVEAIRAFVAEPAAWGSGGGCKTISSSPLNKTIKRAARRTQDALAKKDIHVDLSKLTLYTLKHSIATTAQIASGGILDAEGRVMTAPEVQAMTGHARPMTTQHYIQAAVAPLQVVANQRVTKAIADAFKDPLRPLAKPLRAVK